MYQRLRKHFSASALILSVAALVLALAGGAIAANGGATASKAGPRGKTGKTGKAGPAGVPGTNGTNGKDGTNGTNGKDGAEGKEGKAGIGGTPGTPGVNGKSPENLATLALGEEGCLAGGTLYGIPGVAASEAPVCNGEKGLKGDTGEPWPVGNTLPPGATEMGTWAFTGTAADTNGIHVSLSFPVPLANPLDQEHVHWALESGSTTFCKSNGSNPQPEPGNLCVYLTESVSETEFGGIFSSAEEGEKGALRMGAVLAFSAPTGAAAGGGSFAVRAPLAP